MIAGARVHTTLPATDFARARRFYEETRGFEPVDVQPAATICRAGEGTSFVVFPSSGSAAGTHTQMGFTVTDIESNVAELKRRGVAFEHDEFPGFDSESSIADSGATRAAWFTDSEGNLLGIVEFTSPE